MRRLQVLRPPRKGVNPLYDVYQTVPFFRVLWVVCVNIIARVCPSVRLKNFMYRHFLGMKVGRHTAVALFVMMDALHPEWITIGENCIIGFQSTILTHEYLIDEYRFGPVVIEDDVMIGANTTVLAGVRIGCGAVIGAGSVVAGDIPPHTFAAGSPARVLGPVAHRN